MKYETSLNESTSITDNKFIVKCWSRKNIRKNPEKAIKNFLPTVVNLDLDMFEFSFFLYERKSNSCINLKQVLNTKIAYLYVFLIINISLSP